MDNLTKKLQGTSVEVTASNLSRYVTRLKKSLADEGIDIKHTVAEKVFSKTFGSRNSHEFKIFLSKLAENNSDKKVAEVSQNVPQASNKESLLLNDEMLDDESSRVAQEKARVIRGYIHAIYKSQDIDGKVKNFLVYLKKLKYLSLNNPDCINVDLSEKDGNLFVEFSMGQLKSKANMFDFEELKEALNVFSEHRYLYALFIGLYQNCTLFEALQTKTKLIKNLDMTEVNFYKMDKNIWDTSSQNSKMFKRWFGSSPVKTFLEDVLRDFNWSFNQVYVMNEGKTNKPLCVISKHPTEDGMSYYNEIKILASGEVKKFMNLYNSQADFSFLDEYTLHQWSQS